MDSSTKNEDISNDASGKRTSCNVLSTATATSPDLSLNESNGFRSKIEQHQLDERKKVMQIMEQRDELIEILTRKDNTIKTMLSERNNLETELRLAVSGKLEAIARLEKIEGKEQMLLFREKRIDFDVERLNGNIQNLTANLNENLMELATARQELITASAQYEIDIKDKTEKLRIANRNVFELTQMNQELHNQSQKSAFKLQQQSNESSNLMEAFKGELKAKTDLAELYKANNIDYQEQVSDLTAGIVELKQLLSETADENDVLQNKLKESELDREIELKAKDGVILKLKQELKDANCLLKAYECKEDNNQEFDTADASETVNNIPFTFTELYSKHLSVAKKLQDKDQECKILELEMASLIEDVKQKAIELGTNDKLIAKRNNDVVENILVREELESVRQRCKLLKDENEKLKFFGNEYVKHFLPNDQLNEKLDKLAIARRKSNAVELEQQNQKLLVMVHDLMAKLHGKDKIVIDEDSSGNDDDDENGNGCVTSSTVKVCHKSVQLDENDIRIDGGINCGDIPSPKSLKENVLKIEELRSENHSLKNEIQKLNAEKNLLIAERNLNYVRYNFHSEQIASLNEQNQKHIDRIDDHVLANKYLRDENVKATMKLSNVEDRLAHLENQHRSLSHVKNSLVVEVETLKQELFQEKVSNKNLRYNLELMNASAERMKTELQMRIELSDCRVLLKRQHCEQREVDKAKGVAILRDVSLQADLNVENHGHSTCVSNICHDMVMNASAERMKTELQMRIELSDCRVLLNRQHCEQREVDKAKGVAILRDVSLQADLNVENHGHSTCVSNICHDMVEESAQAKKDNFLLSLQLTKSEPQDEIPKLSSEVKRKRKSQNSHGEIASPAVLTGWKRKLRSFNKKGRVSFVDLLDDSDDDEYVDVCETDSVYKPPNIKLQYLSEVRTRKQAKFIHDAFNSKEAENNQNVERLTLINKKVSQSARKRSCSVRSRSTSSGRRHSRRVQTATRSRSIGHKESTAGHEESAVVHQQSTARPVQLATRGRPIGRKKSTVGTLTVREDSANLITMSQDTANSFNQAADHSENNSSIIRKSSRLSASIRYKYRSCLSEARTKQMKH